MPTGHRTQRLNLVLSAGRTATRIGWIVVVDEASLGNPRRSHSLGGVMIRSMVRTISACLLLFAGTVSTGPAYFYFASGCPSWMLSESSEPAPATESSTTPQLTWESYASAPLFIQRARRCVLGTDRAGTATGSAGTAYQIGVPEWSLNFRSPFDQRRPPMRC